MVVTDARCRLLDDERRRLHQEMRRRSSRCSDSDPRSRRHSSSLSPLRGCEFRHACARRAGGGHRRPHRRGGLRAHRDGWRLRPSSSLALLSTVWMDGWRAGREQASAFGARFDMETDAALILILSLLVWQHGKAGAGSLRCGLMRYAFVALDGCCRGWRLRCARRFAARASPLASSSDSVWRCRRSCRCRSAHRRRDHSGDAGVVVRRGYRVVEAAAR